MCHPLGMGQLASAVAYDGLPISSGGAHGLGRISARDALDAWQHFVHTCALPKVTQCRFILPHTPELDVGPAVAALIQSRFPGGGSSFPVPLARLDEAVDLLESIEPQPTNQWGMAPVWFGVQADLLLMAPHGSEPWPCQNRALFGGFETPAGVQLGTSSTRLYLQAKRSMGLTLSLPEASDGDLAEFIPWLQGNLPFRLSIKHWTRWTLTKNGRTYRGRRIAPRVD